MEQKERKKAKIAVIERKAGEALVVTVRDRDGDRQDIIIYPKRIGNKWVRLCVIAPQEGSPNNLETEIHRIEHFSGEAQRQFLAFIETDNKA